MVSKIAGAIVLSSFLHFLTFAQLGQKGYQFPKGTTASDIEAGAVWVKINDRYKDLFQSVQAGGRIPSLQAKQVKPFVHSRSRNKSAARVGPQKLNVDISLYYKIIFDKNKPVDDYINELNSTGYFDIIEPVFFDQPQLTPNDPAQVNQYYLNIIRAYDAWDITQGSTSIVIGVIDSGGDMDHPDLQNNIFVDPADPTDGIDNDGDGYIDNNRGWDFSGADASLIGTPGYIGDNDPSIPKGNRFRHGTMVAGCASATTNDAVGISGIGYNSKLLFTKHYADNQPDNSTSYSSDLYEGVLYAATHGAKIINCSWGRTNYSVIAQALINHVVLDLGCLVVAAAGNSNNELALYPAAYENVLAVASSDENDIRSTFSNFGRYVDITAPGTNIYTTNYDNAYRVDSGTSLAAPIVSGAAALVWAHRPTLTALQVAEQLRVTSDENLYNSNPSYIYKLGRGRLDVGKALTFTSPSIRASNLRLFRNDGQSPGAGDACKLYLDFANYLGATSSGLTVALNSSSPLVSITKGSVTPGAIAEKQTITNAEPFELTLSSTLPLDQTVELLVTFSDGSYTDFQVVAFTLPSFVDVNENNITTTMTSEGRIGFGNTQTQTNGSGFIYDDKSLLYEMGLIMGNSAVSLFDNVRATGGAYNQEFTAASVLHKNTPGQRSYSEVNGSFRNAPAAGSETLLVSQRSLVWNEAPYLNFIIVEYKIKNTSASQVSDFHFGIFADWDIVSGGAGDRASWDNDTRLGYVHPAIPSSLPQVGIQELNGFAHYYAVDNDPSLSGNPLGIYDGFTDVEKFTTVSSGLGKTQAGMAASGNDVSHVVASGPYTITAGGEITIAFALHGALSTSDLKTSSKYADSVYNYTLKAPKPTVSDIKSCKSSDVTIQPSGATKFNLYRNLIGGSPVSSGAQFEIEHLEKDTTLYISNADKTYESLRSPVAISIVENPTIGASGNLEFCEGGTVTLTASDGDQYTWSTGAKTKSISVNSSGHFSVKVDNEGIECSPQTPLQVTVNPAPSAGFSVSSPIVAPGEEVNFMNATTGALSWKWEFGDGQTSTAENPVHIYSAKGEYSVLLIATSDKGCQASASMLIGSITGTDLSLETNVKLYPNPVYDTDITVRRVVGNSALEVSVMDVQGRIVRHLSLKQNELQASIPVRDLVNGFYVVQIKSIDDTLNSKIIILH